MIIYKDILTGDELLTDTFQLIKKDGLIEVNCSRVTETTKIDDSAIGGNASAEEAGEGAEDSSVTGFDVAIQNRLVEMPPFDKKGYMAYMKGYLKAVKAKMQENGKSDEAIAKFENDMKKVVPTIAKNLGDYQVFCGESMNPDGMMCLLNYRDDGVTPYMIYVEEGLLEEKC